MPRTVFGDSAGGYGDVYNRQEVEEAHSHGDRWRGGCANHRWGEVIPLETMVMVIG